MLLQSYIKSLCLKIDYAILKMENISFPIIFGIDFECENRCNPTRVSLKFKIVLFNV